MLSIDTLREGGIGRAWSIRARSTQCSLQRILLNTLIIMSSIAKTEPSSPCCLLRMLSSSCSSPNLWCNAIDLVFFPRTENQRAWPSTKRKLTKVARAKIRIYYDGLGKWSSITSVQSSVQTPRSQWSPPFGWKMRTYYSYGAVLNRRLKWSQTDH
jgi:hypothetical protein